MTSPPQGSAAERVGVVGLGAMGGAMAANLVAAGFAVVGFDPDAARMDLLTEAGGRPANSPAELAGECDVVILSLPSVAAFQSVAIDTDGLAAGDIGGVTVIETSTLPLYVKERGQTALAQAGGTLLDCPLSGTGDQAVHRDLVVMASGDEAAVRRCRPIFEGFARAHHYVGAFGAGSKLKFVANLLVAVHNVAAAEALALARAAGLDLEQALTVLADGAGASRMLEVRGPKMIAREYGPGIRMEVFDKDLAAIADFAESHASPIPLLTLCTRIYAAAMRGGHDGEDTAAVYELFNRLGSDLPTG